MINHFYSPSISKRMSDSKERLPSSKHNVVVSFKMIYDDFNFSVLNIRIQLRKLLHKLHKIRGQIFSVTTTNLMRDCKNSENHNAILDL